MPDIIKKFFDTFEIEPKPIYSGSKLYNPFVTGYDYPTITDHILLELICIAKGLVITPNCMSIEELKRGVLKVLINFAQVDKDIKQQIQELFKGE